VLGAKTHANRKEICLYLNARKPECSTELFRAEILEFSSHVSRVLHFSEAELMRWSSEQELISRRLCRDGSSLQRERPCDRIQGIGLNWLIGYTSTGACNVGGRRDCRFVSVAQQLSNMQNDVDWQWWNWSIFGPGNGSPIATDVVFVLLGVVVILRLFHFTSDRRQTSHRDWWHYPQLHRVGFSR